MLVNSELLWGGGFFLPPPYLFLKRSRLQDFKRVRLGIGTIVGSSSLVWKGATAAAVTTIPEEIFHQVQTLFSRVQATLHLTLLVGPSIGNIFKF